MDEMLNNPMKDIPDNQKEPILEREGGEPENWVTDVILQRDGKGNVASVDVPDDEEENDDVDNDQA